MDNEIIGKVRYIGKDHKGSITNGKLYDCIGLTFGDIQIIDDSGEAYWYSAIGPALSSGTDRNFWLVEEDNSSNKILSDSISGKISRTSKDLEEEKGKILSSVTIHLDKEKMIKTKSYERNYIDETKETKEYQNKVIDSFAFSMAHRIQDIIREYGSLEAYTKRNEPKAGDTYQFKKAKIKYEIILNKKSWSIYRLTKTEKEFVERLSINKYQDLQDVKAYITLSERY